MTGAPLRRGWTTGACAAAAARAAFAALLTGRFPDPVTIALPKGLTPAFPLDRERLGDGEAEAAVVKDAGDDPDVTHGATIVATVRRGAAGAGVTFAAGEGVGHVTRPGLPLPVGEPAINPAPRAIITDNLRAVATAHGAPLDVAVTIAIPGGAALAQQTLNPRLGIVGGLSVLGTTGVVVPYSCAAWIDSIHRGVDVARAMGLDHVGAATGRGSEAALQRLTGLPDHALIEMGDFAGGLLKYLRRHPVPRLTLAGGLAKLAKLGQGHLDLHSARSRLDTAALAGWLEEAGAAPETVAAVAAAGSGGEAAALAAGCGLGDLVAARARAAASAVAGPRTAIDVLVVDRAGAVVGRCPP